MQPDIASVVLNVPVDEAFDYRVPPELLDRLKPGCRVRVPFGRQGVQTGVCVELKDKSSYPRLRRVDRVLDAEPTYDARMLALGRWMAGYYHCSWGEALAAFLPAGVDPDRAASTYFVVQPTQPPEALREQAAKIAKRASRQARALRVLADVPEGMPQSSLCRQADADSSVLAALEGQGFLKRERVRAKVDPFRGEAAERDTPPDLTEHQQAALDRLKPFVEDAAFQVALLHGVTGSGKTEVYLRVLREVVERRRQGIVLVPEISLTPQTVRRFRARFAHVAVLHSNLSDRERLAEWRRIRAGKVDVVVGARSAVFAPVPSLGLLVVDEEHETSFKQDNAPRYHARDVGIVRARAEKALVILGSATPSLESLRNTVTGKSIRLSLPCRVRDLPLPRVEILNLGVAMTEARRRVILAPRLERAVRVALKNDEQVILFLNRRGFATFIQCPECGFVLRCDQCDVSLTYHSAVNLARCHYCLHEEPPPETCPACASRKIKQLGLGTQRAEEHLRKRFPDHVIARMDTDSMRGRGRHAEVLGAFRRGEVHILLGTQMIAKGLDFPNVTVVGVINADTALNLPDFRATERTFQLLAQVGGRAGRGDKGGVVYIQTFSPEHPCIRAAAAHDYNRFAEEELKHRREYGYPPFGRIVRIVCDAKKPEAAEQVATEVAEAIRAAADPNAVQILGPAPAPLAMLRGRTRWHLCVKSKTVRALQQALANLKRGPRSGAQITVDVDPLSML